MTNLQLQRRGVDAAARIGKALDHPLRIRAIAALRDRELCVCELTELFGLAASTVSKHMSLIADAGLVDRRRDGKWTYYALPTESEPAIVHAIEAVLLLVKDDPVILEDRANIPRINCASEGHCG